MKKSFSILEVILSISLIGFLYTMFIPKTKINHIDELTNKLSLYISHLRYKALVDNKYDLEDELWHKKRWTIKFFRCKESVGGLYYVMYSDKNRTGHPGADDSLKDPLTNKNIYSSNNCDENKKNSKYVLLTKEFGIKDVQVSCNETTSLGQLSFGSDGKVYSRLSAFKDESNEYEIEDSCIIKLITQKNESREIKIHPITGYNKKESVN